MTNTTPTDSSKDYLLGISNLRQWLNEDRITDPNKMVTNEQIKIWLEDKTMTHDWEKEFDKQIGGGLSSNPAYKEQVKSFIKSVVYKAVQAERKIWAEKQTCKKHPELFFKYCDTCMGNAHEDGRQERGNLNDWMGKTEDSIREEGRTACNARIKKLAEGMTLGYLDEANEETSMFRAGWNQALSELIDKI